jgi:hypothetical protein
VELCGGLATGLEALFKAGYAIRSYVWVDIDPDAHMAVSHRITHLRQQFPNLFLPEALTEWDSRLPRVVRTISPKLIRATFPDGVDLLLASPLMQACHLPGTHRDHTPMGPDVVRHILRLILYLSESQSEGVGYLWSSSELHPASATILSLVGQGTLLDAPKCGSGAYRNTRIWQNLMSHDALMKEHARLLPPTRPVDAALTRAGLSRWSTFPTLGAGDQPQLQ